MSTEHDLKQEIERLKKELAYKEIQLHRTMRECEDRYRRITETISDYVYTVRVVDGRALSTRHGAACVGVTGYSSEEFNNDSYLWYHMVHEDDRRAVVDHANQILSGSCNEPIEHRIIRKDGLIRWVRNTPVLHHDQKGTLESYEGLIADITELKTSEEIRMMSEERYSQLFTHMDEGVALHKIVPDAQGRPVNYRIISVNPRFEVILGLSAKNMLGKLATDAYGTTEPPYLKEYSGAVASGEVSHFETHFAPLGKYFWVSVVPMGPQEFATVFFDLTERKAAEAALQNQQRLESLGILAGGIAHDFNNLLAGVFGYIDLAQEHVNDPQVTLVYLNKAMNAFDRARALTQQLLTFSKGGTPVKKPVKVDRLLQDAVGFVLSGSTVRAQYSLAPDLLNCEVDEHQIGQVVDNIVINAQQAMPQGGVIKVTAVNTGVHDALPAGMVPGEYVKVSIQDYGTGIPPEHLPKIFDPFFTTKQKGSGLGLATSYSIIRRHGGQIEVDSVLGKGTTFHVYLPAVHLAAQEKVRRSEAVASGFGRILVMDDEAVMRDLATLILQSTGYSVEVAADGAEAVEKYTQEMKNGKRFDLVILDLTIAGGMGGKDTIVELHKLDPAVKGIVSSGYSDDPVVAEPAKYGFAGVAPKPYTKQELIKVIEEIKNKN